MAEITKNSTVAAFGELLIRLSPPGAQRLQQMQALEMHAGGAEANVLATLTALGGVQARMVSSLPDNLLAAWLRERLLSRSISTDHILTGDGRVGSYYYEAGQGQRAGRVVYDRAYSAFCALQPSMIHWQQALQGAQLLHISGISPAVSAGAAAVCAEGMQAAHQRGLRLSFDLNYRSTLWGYGSAPTAVVPALLQHAHIIIADQTAAEKMLGIAAPDQSLGIADQYAYLGKKINELAPAATHVAFSHRTAASYGGYVWDVGQQQLVAGAPYTLGQVADRIGTGDAFVGGLLHALVQQGAGTEAALNFGIACGVLKHSIVGDMLVASHTDVVELMQQQAPGRIHR